MSATAAHHSNALRVACLSPCLSSESSRTCSCCCVSLLSSRTCSCCCVCLPITGLASSYLFIPMCLSVCLSAAVSHATQHASTCSCPGSAVLLCLSAALHRRSTPILPKLIAGLSMAHFRRSLVLVLAAFSVLSRPFCSLCALCLRYTLVLLSMAVSLYLCLTPVAAHLFLSRQHSCGGRAPITDHVTLRENLRSRPRLVKSNRTKMPTTARVPVTDFSEEEALTFVGALSRDEGY